jgi:hypothetical protein
MVDERLGYLSALLAKEETRFRMLNMCCSGFISDEWWAGLGTFYRQHAKARGLLGGL